MAEARIPVDLTNPGQVFACLGFMEAAAALGLQGVQGGFDWSEPTNVEFCIGTTGEQNPIEAVLRFLAEAEIHALVPHGDTEIKLKTVPTDEDAPNTYPVALPAKKETAPVVLTGSNAKIIVHHWADTAGVRPFKTFAGQQVAAEIYRKLLCTEYGKVSKNRPQGKRLTQAFDTLFADDEVTWIATPFEPCAALETAFGFDARGAWDPMRIGSSLDVQKLPTGINAVVELLAPIGLSHARPQATNAYNLEYGVWADMLPLMLARLFLGSPERMPGMTARRFKAHLGNDKYYKKFFFATEFTT